MDPISALIGGGASLLGNVFTASTNASNTQANIAAQEQMQQQTEAFNAGQAQLNRQWQQGMVANQENYQTMMSNTAYQRASADMKKAGLNPMMMFGSGGPASSPGGSMGAGATAAVGTPNMGFSAKTSPLGNLGDVVAKAVSTSAGVRSLDKLNEETRQQKATADQAEAVAEKERLGLPQARLNALEAQTRLGLPKEDITTHATHEYRFGSGIAGYGGQAMEQGANILNRTVDRLIEAATGPTSKALWDRVRNTQWPKFDNPNIRGTTLNPDYGSQYNTP